MYNKTEISLFGISKIFDYNTFLTLSYIFIESVLKTIHFTLFMFKWIQTSPLYHFLLHHHRGRISGVTPRRECGYRRPTAAAAVIAYHQKIRLPVWSKLDLKKNYQSLWWKGNLTLESEWIKQFYNLSLQQYQKILKQNNTHQITNTNIRH